MNYVLKQAGRIAAVTLAAMCIVCNKDNPSGPEPTMTLPTHRPYSMGDGYVYKFVSTFSYDAGKTFDTIRGVYTQTITDTVIIEGKKYDRMTNLMKARQSNGGNPVDSTIAFDYYCFSNDSFYIIAAYGGTALPMFKRRVHSSLKLSSQYENKAILFPQLRLNDGFEFIDYDFKLFPFYRPAPGDTWDMVEYFSVFTKDTLIKLPDGNLIAAAMYESDGPEITSRMLTNELVGTIAMSYKVWNLYGRTEILITRLANQKTPVDPSPYFDEYIK